MICLLHDIELFGNHVTCIVSKLIQQQTSFCRIAVLLIDVYAQVPVPVMKPYPVHVPYIKPVFHHTKSRDEYDSDHGEDDDYLPRPEGKNKYSPYKKKIPNG